MTSISDTMEIPSPTNSVIHPRWSDHEDEALRSSWGCMPFPEIAKILPARTPCAIEHRASVIGLSALAKHKPSRKRYVELLLSAVGENSKFGLSDLLGHRKREPLPQIRWRAWAILRAEGASYPGIGMVAGRDHTSILYGVRRALGEGPKTAGRKKSGTPELRLERKAKRD